LLEKAIATNHAYSQFTYRLVYTGFQTLNPNNPGNRAGTTPGTLTFPGTMVRAPPIPNKRKEDADDFYRLAVKLPVLALQMPIIGFRQLAVDISRSICSTTRIREIGFVWSIMILRRYRIIMLILRG
jgi:hypothetical protein